MMTNNINHLSSFVGGKLLSNDGGHGATTVHPMRKGLCDSKKWRRKRKKKEAARRRKRRRREHKCREKEKKEK